MTNKTVSFRSTPVWVGVEATIMSGPKKVKYDQQILIHTAQNDFPIMKLVEFEEHNDYVASTAGSIHISFMMGLGDYVYKLYPFRDMLEVTIKKILQKDTGQTEDEDDSPTLRYRAILDITKNPKVTAQRINNVDYETLNQSDVVQISLELLDRNLEVIRVATTPGGIYPQATMDQIIPGVMVGESNKWLIDGKPAVECFNMVPADNLVAVPNAYIPSIKLSLVPTYLQEKISGVYNSGLGTHYQRVDGKPSWYVYPLFNTDRFDEDVERMVIYAVPEDELSGLDRTYRKEGKILYVVAAGQHKYEDDSQISDLNEGVGIRLPNATSVMNNGANLTPAGPVADRARANAEIGNRKRADGVYYAPTVAPSDNLFKYTSRLAGKQVSNLNLVWENSEPDYVYPGMPCKYIFMDGGEYRELKGIILGRYTVKALIGPPITTNTYRQSTNLAIALEYYEDTPTTQPVMNSPGYF